MQVSRVDQPADQGPCLFGIPAPPAAPGLVSPDSAADDANGEQQKTNGDRAVAEIVQSFAEGNRCRLEHHRPAIGLETSPLKTTAAD